MYFMLFKFFNLFGKLSINYLKDLGGFFFSLFYSMMVNMYYTDFTIVSIQFNAMGIVEYLVN